MSDSEADVQKRARQKAQQEKDEIDKRFEVLEMKVAFQEELIQQLDDALISQQNQLSNYQAQIEILKTELETMESQASDEPEPPPPHY